MSDTLTRPHHGYPTVLSCPQSFANCDIKTIREIVNGCGDGWRERYIPDTLYGLNVRPACEIHDWEYVFGRTIDDKELADRRFLNNLLRMIERLSANRMMIALRNRRALKYYEAVRLFGGPAFWDGKKTAEVRDGN